MQKQTMMLIAFPLLAVAAGGLLYLAAPAGKFGTPLETTKPTAQTPPVEVPVQSNIIVPVPPAPPEDQTRIPFNGQEPSLQGTITAVTKTRVTFTVVQQPPEGSELITKTFHASIPADAPILSVGQGITVYFAKAADMENDPIPATRITPYQPQNP